MEPVEDASLRPGFHANTQCRQTQPEIGIGVDVAKRQIEARDLGENSTMHQDAAAVDRVRHQEADKDAVGSEGTQIARQMHRSWPPSMDIASPRDFASGQEA